MKSWANRWVLTFSSCLLVMTQWAFANRVDEYIGSVMAERDIPGLALAVVKDGQIVKEKAYGLASIELTAPATTDTIFQIASTTKLFGGVAIMMLVEEGKLSLDDKVTDVLPDLPAHWSDVTVRQIMTHTSGLPDLWERPNVMWADTPEGIIEVLEEKPFDFEPGAQWSYNQTGYLLAGMIIKRLSGLEFGEFCAQRIFRPLGLTSARFGGVKVLVPGRATYYEGDDAGGLRPYVDGLYSMAGIMPAAGLNLSIGDFAQFDIALASGRLLRPETLEMMWSPATRGDGSEFRYRGGTTGYGCGWAIIDYPHHRAVGHEGGLTNAYYRFVEDDLAVIVLTNRVGRNAPVSIVEEVAALYVSEIAQATVSPAERFSAFRALLTEEHDEAAAYRLARKIIDDFSNNAAMLNAVAWTIVDTPNLPNRDLDLALAAAVRASERTSHRNAAILDTVARVHYERGDLDTAIDWQRKAAEFAIDDELGESIRKALQRYEGEAHGP